MKEEKDYTDNFDEDQIFGDNNHVTRINVEEREKGRKEENNVAERARDIKKEADTVRSKLNQKRNQIRNS